jgi:hypothetical protein
MTVGFWVVSQVAAQEGNPFRPFDPTAFEHHVRGLGAGPEQIEAFRAGIRDHPGISADGLLRSLVDSYGRAVDQAENGDPRAALSLAEIVASTKDLYVRAHARYHLGRTFLDGDDADKASHVLADFLQHDRNLTPLDAEAAFFYATSLADTPMPGLAARAFGDYLRIFPDAPERYRAVAQQRRAELLAQFLNPLHEIADSMKGIERRLRRAETGRATQDEQHNIIARLQELIDQLEEQEKQSSGGPSGNTQPNAAANNSAAPSGASRIGDLARIPGVSDRWGDLKERKRKEIEAEAQTKLPSRYAKMLEDYYKKLGRGRSR